MKTTRAWGAFAALALTGAAMSGCASSGGGSAGGGTDGGTYSIGMIAALSGPSAQTGQHERDGAQTAVDVINGAGGVNGKKLKLVVKDGAANANQGVTAFNDLVSDKDTIGIFGGTYGSVTLAFKPLADRNKIPVIAPNSTYEVTHPQSPWVFRDLASAQVEVDAALKAAKAAGINKIGILHTTDAYGTQGAELLAKGGLNVVDAEEMDPAATDVTTQLTKLRAANPDAIFLWATTPSTGLALKNAGQLGLTIPILSGDAGPTAGNLTAAGGSSALEHWLAEGFLDPSNPLPRQQKAVEALKKAHPDYAPDVYSAAGYSGLELFAKALAKAGKDASRESLRNAIEKLSDVESLAGIYSYSANNHDGVDARSVIWLRPQGGAFTRVEPSAVLG